jgi:isoleucyl-tRNA synthetase
VYKTFQEGKGTECLYLEGGDQHRGWFHSSLLTSVALRNRAPYSHVATAGWTLDEQGRAMSKSLGNGVDPVDIAERMGGEIVRLWVASIDFREDMAASENLMQRCAELYRKLRNTFRFLLGNLNGFDPARDRVSEAELLPLDQYMLARTRDLTEKILAWYEAFEFHRVYQALNDFAIVDLSSFYLDILKDRMYTFAPTSQPRRSAQTVLWQITEALVRLVAPILSFTADEAWFLYRPGKSPSVHLLTFPQNLADYRDDALAAKWETIRDVRRVVTGALELERAAKRIGSSLEASPLIHVSDKAVFGTLFDVDMAEVCITSNAMITNEDAPPDAFRLNDVPGVAVVVEKAAGTKCARSWKILPTVGEDPEYPDVSPRDAKALREWKAMGVVARP